MIGMATHNSTHVSSASNEFQFKRETIAVVCIEQQYLIATHDALSCFFGMGPGIGLSVVLVGAMVVGDLEEAWWYEGVEVWAELTWWEPAAALRDGEGSGWGAGDGAIL